MPDIFANAATLATTGSAGTTSPAAGTIETWTVSALSASWPTLLLGQTMTIQDANAQTETIRILTMTAGGTSISVLRGADGSTPVAHAAAAVFTNTVGSGMLNLIKSPVVLPYLHRALASVAAGTAGDKIVMLIGDSGIYGYNGPNGIGPALILAKILTAAGYPSALGLSIPNVSGGLGTDARWNDISTWFQAATSDWMGGLGPLWLAGAGAAMPSLEFTPGAAAGSYDSFDLWYQTSPGYGGFSWNVDGGTNTVVNASAANGFAKSTITGLTAGTGHVVEIGTTTGGGVGICGVAPWLSTVPKLRIANCGVEGASASSWTSTAGGAGFGPLDAIGDIAPDVGIIALGHNDGVVGVTVAAFLASLLTIANKVKLSGDVVIVTPYPQNGAYEALEALYAAALPAFCAANGFGLIDMYNRWGGSGGVSVLNPLGYYYDNNHPSATIGYPDMALAFAEGLLSL